MKLLASSFNVPIDSPGVGIYLGNFPDLGQLLTILLQTVIIVAGLATFIFLLLGGVQFITSGGEKVQMEAAKGKITSSILGLVIVVASYALTRVIETVFGISIVSGIKWPGP